MAQRQVPAGRYGTQSRRAPRWTYWVLLAAFVVAGVVVAGVGYHNLGSQPIDGSQVAYQVLDDHSVRITFNVTRDHPDQPADCIVSALSQDGSEGGRKEVYVPPGGASTNLSTVVRTTTRASTGDVYGCSYQVPSYLAKEPLPRG